LEVSFLDKHNKVYSTLGVIDYDEHFLLLCRFICIRQQFHSASVVLCVSM
jgi:hypothetical protein